MFKDAVASVDKVVAELNVLTPPRFPCAACGRETKEHTPDDDGKARRICSMPACRRVHTWHPPEG